MKFLLRILSLVAAFSVVFTSSPAAPATPVAAKGLSAVPSSVSGVTPWAEEISDNGAVAGIVTVPPVIRVANSGYSLTNQAITASDRTTIQTHLINYTARTMEPYLTAFSIRVPEGASEPTVTVTTQGAGVVYIEPINVGSNPYSWRITGGQAIAGNYIDYTFTYTYNSRQYVQKAASYVDLVELGAGWQTYVVRNNWIGTIRTRHEYTSLLAGSGSTTAHFGVYGGGGNGYYNMATGGGSTGFTAISGTAGMRLWDPGADGKKNVEHWYCGQSGAASEDTGDGGHRATLDVYYDPAFVTNLSQLGIKMLYWRTTSPDKMPTLFQEKMIYLLGNSTFSNSSSSNATAQSYFYSTNALNNRTQGLPSTPSSMVFNFASTALPPHGQQVTFASGIFGEDGMPLYTWNAWRVTFYVMDKSALRALLQTEHQAFRQLHDGYLNTDGSFTAYRAQLAKSMAVLNQPNASPTQIAAAVTDLNAAINNLKYQPANYTALNTLINSIYSPAEGYRPSPLNDPDYYYFGTAFYPKSDYDSTAAIDATLNGIVYGLDVRYQSYVDAVVDEVNAVWRTIVLKSADYTVVYQHLEKISGYNDLTGSEAGNYILANPAVYPQYSGQMIYWRHLTPASYAVWETAVLSVVLGYKIPDQSAVTQMAVALQTAYAGLQILPADYTELNALRALANAAISAQVFAVNPVGGGHNLSLYSPASVSTMQEKLNTITEDILMPDQVIVYNWTVQLQTAYNAKTFNTADYTYANEQKNTPALYEAAYQNYYTTASWQTLVSARNAVIAGRTADKQTDVNTWASAIFNARNALVLLPANYAAVEAALLAVSEKNPALYTNWSIVEDAVDAVVYGLDVTQQEDVTAMADAVYAALDALVLYGADYSDVLDAVQAAASYNEALYENWAAVEAALAAIVYDLDVTRQDDVDAMAAAVFAALNALIFRGADYSGVLDALAEAAGYTAALYANWSAVEDAINAVVYGLDITHQDEVDAFAVAIFAALGALIYRDGDYTEVLAAIAAADALNSSLYTNWSTVEGAVEAVIYDLDITHQNDIDAFAAAIFAAIDALVYRDADYTLVLSALDAANALDAALYANWATVEDAVEAIVYGLDITHQNDVDAFAAAIYAAMDALVMYEADYTAVTVAVAAATERNPSYYANWSLVQNALDAVIYGLDLTQQNTVDAYAATIQSALSRLVLLDADYTGVLTAIAAANALNPEEYSDWQPVEDAINAVIYGIDITSQYIVDAYAAAIWDAINGLERALADLTGLLDALTLTGALFEIVYTPESWSVLAAAVAQATAILEADPPYELGAQAEVDAAALAVLQAIDALAELPVFVQPAEESPAILDSENGYIYGLTTDGNINEAVLGEFISVVGNGRLVLIPTSHGSGTGTVAQLVRDGDNKVLATYILIVFGDLDGDGLVDGNDLFFAHLAAAGIEDGPLTDAMRFAADVNADGIVDETDIALIQAAGLFLAEIAQSR